MLKPYVEVLADLFYPHACALSNTSPERAKIPKVAVAKACRLTLSPRAGRRKRAGRLRTPAT